MKTNTFTIGPRGGLKYTFRLSTGGQDAVLTGPRGGLNWLDLRACGLFWSREPLDNPGTGRQQVAFTVSDKGVATRIPFDEAIEIERQHRLALRKPKAAAAIDTFSGITVSVDY